MKVILFIMAIVTAATVGMAQAEKAIIPVVVWPKTISTADKLITGPTVEECVSYGYRLLTAKPATPTGKRIASEKIVQDDKNSTRCKYDIVYEDIPVKPTPAPEVLVEIPATNVIFMATSNGVPRSWKLKTMPKTNMVVIAE